jgi:hypothetical protein
VGLLWNAVLGASHKSKGGIEIRELAVKEPLQRTDEPDIKKGLLVKINE